MPKTPCQNRRGFLRHALLGAAGVPVAGLVISGTSVQVRADTLERAEDGHAHDYVNDAADAAGHELFEDGQLCENCIFWTGEVEDGWGGCQHPDFEGVLVNAEGWCSAYVPGA